MFHKKQPQKAVTGENRSLQNLWQILKDWVLTIAKNHCTACPKLCISRKRLFFNASLGCILFWFFFLNAAYYKN